MGLDQVRKELLYIYDRITLYAEVYSMRDIAETVKRLEAEIADADVVEPDVYDDVVNERDDYESRLETAEARVRELEDELAELKDAQVQA